MKGNEMIVMENNKKEKNYNSDTALFEIVNRHAEEMAEKRRIEDYERLKREEKERQMEAMRQKKEKVVNVMNIIKNLVFILSVVFNHFFKVSHNLVFITGVGVDDIPFCFCVF